MDALDQIKARAEAAEAALEAVLGLHTPEVGLFLPQCGECGDTIPCRTVRVIEEALR